MSVQKDSTAISRAFKGIWIPAEIWLHPRISIQSKTLWAEINSLDNEEAGGCYASDDYLMNFMGLKKSRLHEILSELKSCGLLMIMSFDGRTRVLKAITPDPHGRLPSKPVELRVPENRKAPIRKTGKPSYIENKDELKEQQQATPSKAPPSAAAFFSKIESELKSLGVTEKERKKWKYTEAQVQKALEVTGEVKRDNPLKSFRAALKDDWEPSMKDTVNSRKKTLLLIEKVLAAMKIGIEITKNYIIFPLGEKIDLELSDNKLILEAKRIAKKYKVT